MRYLAAKHRAQALEPADARARARAIAWMDWQLSVLGPAITPFFVGLVRTPPEKRDHAAIEESKKKTTEAFAILDGALAENAFVAGGAFSYGDIPSAVMANRYRQLALRPASVQEFRALVRGHCRAAGIQEPGGGGGAGMISAPAARPRESGDPAARGSELNSRFRGNERSLNSAPITQALLFSRHACRWGLR